MTTTEFALAKKNLANWGLDDATIGQLIDTHGEAVLWLLESGFQNGFSQVVLLEILAKMGCLVLKLLIAILTKRKWRMAGPGLAEGHMAEVTPDVLAEAMAEVLEGEKKA